MIKIQTTFNQVCQQILTLAVAKSHFSDKAIKSPNDDIRSAPRARA